MELYEGTDIPLILRELDEIKSKLCDIQERTGAVVADPRWDRFRPFERIHDLVAEAQDWLMADYGREQWMSNRSWRGSLAINGPDS